MKKEKIVLYDDDSDVVKQYSRKLLRVPEVRDSFNVDSLGEREFEEAMAELESRRLSLREGREKQGPCELDDAAVLIVDYDLLGPKSKPFMASGENVAYLARCFSRCRFIVGLNQFGDNVFDLSLRGHPESMADVNIGSSQLSNRGLWSENWPSYRPWSWPNIIHELQALSTRIDEVSRDSKANIFSTLCIPREIARLLPRRSLEFISPDAENATFEALVYDSGNVFSTKDAQAARDAGLSAKRIASMAAQRTWCWLETFVLPGQDVLIDAPHLVSRYPSLLKGKKTLDQWNSIATMGLPDREAMEIDAIEQHRFRKDYWLSRTAWFWPGVSSCEDVLEVRKPWSRTIPDYVFCEDTSSFNKKEECREFMADLRSPYVQRYVRGQVEDMPKISYRPSLRFSIKRDVKVEPDDD